MKTFRGTFIAVVALALVWWSTRPDTTSDPTALVVNSEASVRLFNFEKSALNRVQIKRAQDTITLAEHLDGHWTIEGPGWRAASSMVNRIKHQLHDLSARAVVVENAEKPELYGLGTNAIRVTLEFRDGETLKFDVGDPNPTAVSWYVRPHSGDTVFTAKKSALDSFEMPISEFRERRFASFEAADADRIEASIRGHAPLILQRTEEDGTWQIESPIQARAGRESAQRLLGRISALKAAEFGPDSPTDLVPFGLAEPRATITVKFGSRDPLVVNIGDAIPSQDSPVNEASREQRSYVSIEGIPTLFIARSQFLEDFTAPPEQLRNLRFMRLKPSDVSAYSLQMNDHDGLSTDRPINIRRSAENWMWEDGSIAAGSTTKRMVERSSNIRAKDIASEQAEPAHGFGTPRLELRLNTSADTSRVLLIGSEAPPELVPQMPIPGPPGAAPVAQEGPREERRFYAQTDDDPIVYLVDSSILTTALDLEREYKRKATKQAERKARLDKVEEE